MSTQQVIPFSRAHARTSDPVTSKAAAESLTPRILSKIQIEIYSQFLVHRRLTDEELDKKLAHLNVAPSTLRSRRADLCSFGLLKDSGATDINSRGRYVVIWELVEAK